MAAEDGSVDLHVELTADDARILRGALTAARATERGELERRAARHHFGYGSDAARASMDDDVGRFRRRIELLDALITALETATVDGDDSG